METLALTLIALLYIAAIVVAICLPTISPTPSSGEPQERSLARDQVKPQAGNKGASWEMKVYRVGQPLEPLIVPEPSKNGSKRPLQ